MCGRYVLFGPASRLQEYFDLGDCPDFAPRYNIAPTSQILVVRQGPQGRATQFARWGLIPSWAKDAAIGAKLNNARAETVAEKPSFRNSFARHRCLIPANGFYEWQAVSEQGRSRKQPWYAVPADDGLFAFAGLLARWRSPEGTEVVSTCIITTEANEIMAPVHERMPVILAPRDFNLWLDPGAPAPEALKALLRPAPASAMRIHPVAPAVSRAGNEGAGLILPLA